LAVEATQLDADSRLESIVPADRTHLQVVDHAQRGLQQVDSCRCQRRALAGRLHHRLAQVEIDREIG